ncbi:MAG: DUF1295 domain-containing protein [Corynebacteriales bacterium]|nr:DUF1295 domain-containing protein [Mycobacteriales bacterium]
MVGVKARRHRIVDVVWGAGFALVAVLTLALSAGEGNATRRWIIAALTIIWGLRLAVYIAWRSRGKPEDPRYANLLANAERPHLYALRMIYLLQAVMLWFISWPVQVGSYDPDPPGVAFWLGIVVCAVGIAFETIGDAQLAAFKRARSGNVLDTGLWRYTRHPNYFGDACMWWGLYLLALGSWLGAATILSPLLMTYFLLAKTGKPLMEAHMSRRPGYAEYVARTSGFFPLPPRRK